MENIVKELKKEFLGKEVSLYDLDCTCQSLANQEELTFNDILSSENWEHIPSGNFTIIEKFDDFGTWDSGINIEFEVIEDSENKSDIIVKIKDIEAL